MTKLSPKCLNNQTDMFVSSHGYLLPCCWADKKDLFDGEMKSLVKEKFRLDKVTSIQEIILSPEWQDFYNMLRNGGSTKICELYCPVNFTTKSIK